MGVEIKATKSLTALILSVLPTLEQNISNQGSDLYHSNYRASNMYANHEVTTLPTRYWGGGGMVCC